MKFCERPLTGKQTPAGLSSNGLFWLPLSELVDKPQRKRSAFQTEAALAKIDKNSKKDQHKVDKSSTFKYSLHLKGF